MEYGKFEDVVNYAKSCLSDYDFSHTQRVLNYAMQILESEKKAAADVVILSAILHAVGRADGVSSEHAKVGSEKSYA